MESLADQIAKMTGGRTSDTRPPTPSLRTCPFCLERHEFRDDWTCSGCGEKATIHTDISKCEDCGGRRERMYTRNRLRSDHCECQLTPEQRKFRQMQRETIARNMALDRKRRGEFEQREREARADADACWKQRNYDCDAPRDQLPICNYCQRWNSSAKLPKPLEFEEIPLEEETV